LATRRTGELVEYKNGINDMCLNKHINLLDKYGFFEHDV